MRFLFLCAALLPLTATACKASWESDQRGEAASPSGQGATRNYAATGFTSVDLRGSDDVQVKIGPSFAVQAQGDPKVLDQLDIRVDGTTLRVGRKDGSSWGFHHDRGAIVTVTLPRLLGASVAGSGDLTADAGEGDFRGSVAGSGNLKVAQLQGGNIDLSIAGSGDMTIAGTATRFSANVAGSGDLDARALTAAGADVSVAGSGNVAGTVNGDAKVSIVGSGDVDLGKGARCAVSAMGSGEAHCS